jgi:hypothetical protein
MWHLGYADSMKHEHHFTGDDDGISDSGVETDDTYNVAEDSDSDSTGSDSVEDDFDLEPVCLSPSQPLTTVLETNPDLDDESTFNGLWYINSGDDESDDTDNYETIETDEDEHNDNTDVNNRRMDEGLLCNRTPTTPFQLSTRESRAQNYFVRSCNGLSRVCTLNLPTPNVVHVSS